MRYKTFARALAAALLQVPASKAARAAATAASTSTGDASAAFAITADVAGSTTSKVLSSWPARQVPPISSWVGRSVVIIRNSLR